jgi:acetylornithine deacetylase/succinyl-diaminopimelate desuccinylase-like protein
LLAFIAEVAGTRSYTVTDAWSSPSGPVPDSVEVIYGFDTPPDSEVVRRAQAALAAGMGRTPELFSYQFATDGRLFVPYGLPIVGFAPGEGAQAHTAGESISIAQMEEALRGLAQLLREF